MHSTEVPIIRSSEHFAGVNGNFFQWDIAADGGDADELCGNYDYSGNYASGAHTGLYLVEAFPPKIHQSFPYDMHKFSQKNAALTK
jgi:hypothetical protein